MNKNAKIRLNRFNYSLAVMIGKLGFEFFKPFHFLVMTKV